MSRDSGDLDRSVRRWWRWFTVTLLLLIPFDLLTTLIAVAEHGTAVEANPIVRWLLQQGLLAIVVVNLFAGILAVVLFHVAMEQFRGAAPSPSRSFVLFVNLWIGILVVSGVGVAVQNLLVIV